MNLLYSLTTEELEGFKTAEVAAIYNSLVSLGEFVPRPILKIWEQSKRMRLLIMSILTVIIPCMPCPSGPSLVSLRCECIIIIYLLYNTMNYLLFEPIHHGHRINSTHLLRAQACSQKLDQ